MERNITHKRNNKTIDDLKNEISDLKAKIQENTRIIDKDKIEITQKSSEASEASEASDLNALIIEKDNELKQAIARSVKIQEDFNRELANLIQQRDTAFRNINSSDSRDSGITVNGGRRTIWRRRHSRRHRINSRKSRKIRRTRRKHRSLGRR